MAEPQASLFRNLDTTFTALADVAQPFIPASIAGGPPALEEAIRTFRCRTRSSTTARSCSTICARASPPCAVAAPPLADALVIGTPTLKR